MERKIRRGDMFYVALPDGIGSEQDGFRPALVIQNNIGNKHSQTVIVAIITSRINSKAKLPTHCYIRAQQGLGRDSMVMLEQIRTVATERLHTYLGVLDSNAMAEVDRALAVSVGLNNTQI